MGAPSLPRESGAIDAALTRAFTLAVQDRWMGASETLSCPGQGLHTSILLGK